MRNPARALGHHFLRATPLTLLLVGFGATLLDSSGLYIAAQKDGVLYIPGGIGLLQDFGLFSTVVGNAILIYLARRYYDAVCSIRISKAVTKTAPVEELLSTLASMIKMEGKYRFLMYLFVFIGALYWATNTSFHVFGDAEARWGHKVFDSTDHTLSFYASRLHNAYTWLIVMPLVGYVVIYTSIQLRRIVKFSVADEGLYYDLLNPDQRGGFLFIETSRVIFNVLIAIVYVQITLHIGTFERMNAEHIIAYVVVTLLLVVGHRIFFGDTYSRINDLRTDALNARKENVYKDDALSFEILKYCYDRKVYRFSIMNLITKTAAIGLSGAVKLLPLFTKTLHLSL